MIFADFLRIMFDRASPNKSILQFIHNTSMNLLTESINRAVSSEKNNWLVIIRNLPLIKIPSA